MLFRSMTLASIRAAGIIYASSACALGVAWELMAGAWRPFTPDYRFTGTVDANAQGLTCAILAISLITYQPATRIVNTIRRLAVVLAMILLLLTQSRGATIALLVSLLALSLMRRKHAGRLVAIGAMSIVTCALLVALVVDIPKLETRFRATVSLQRDTVGAEYAGDARFEVWKLCLTQIRYRPLLGFGYGTFWSKERMQQFQDSLGWTVTQSHCGYIQIALDVGLIGLIGMAATFTMALIEYSHIYRVTLDSGAKFATAVIVIFLTGMLFESINATTYITNILTLCMVTRQVLSMKHSAQIVQAR